MVEIRQVVAILFQKLYISSTQTRNKNDDTYSNEKYDKYFPET